MTTTKLLTRQQVFNKVAKHLLTQKKRSALKNGDCRYLGPKGMKCAVGCLIPEDYYNPSIEGVAVGSCVGKDVISMVAKYELLHFILKRSGVNAKSKKMNSLLTNLQILQDRTYVKPAEWAEELERIARYHGLTFPNSLLK